MEPNLILDYMQRYFYSDITRDCRFRWTHLIELQKAIRHFEPEIIESLRADLGKAPQESYMTEIGMVLKEIDFAVKHVNKWFRLKRKPTPLSIFPATSRVIQEPYGSVLIMSPWNYPFQLAMIPLIGAVAAGNCVVLKPSELAPHTANIIETIIKEVFPPQYVSVVQGDASVGEALLNCNFDMIFFTGSPKVGRIVMEHAAKNLTPVVLELGGKSPCIVHKSADMEMAAQRITFGKFLNAGQTCVAPDYVVVNSESKEQFIKYLQIAIEKAFGKKPLYNEELPRIISDHHFTRLLRLMEGEKIAVGGEFDRAKKKIAPTILDDITWESPVMQEEIFGPILPVISYDNYDRLLSRLKRAPSPLAFYIFSEDESAIKDAIHTVPFGGGCVNDTVMHLVNSHLPFGGIGNSGMGKYHGKYSFDTFSHSKSIVRKLHYFDLRLRYHPYDEKKYKIIRKFMK